MGALIDAKGRDRVDTGGRGGSGQPRADVVPDTNNCRLTARRF